MDFNAPSVPSLATDDAVKVDSMVVAARVVGAYMKVFKTSLEDVKSQAPSSTNFRPLLLSGVIMARLACTAAEAGDLLAAITSENLSTLLAPPPPPSALPRETLSAECFSATTKVPAIRRALEEGVRSLQKTADPINNTYETFWLTLRDRVCQAVVVRSPPTIEQFRLLVQSALHPFKRSVEAGRNDDLLARLKQDIKTIGPAAEWQPAVIAFWYGLTIEDVLKHVGEELDGHASSWPCAIYFGTATTWGTGAGGGPWIMADLENENGLFSGGATGNDAADLSITSRFVTAVVEGEPGTWAIRDGDAASGALSTFYSGARLNVARYNPMHKEGPIILGIGGDNSNGAQGTFYDSEGAMTSGYPTDATENLVQANIVAAKYAVTSLVSGPAISVGSAVLYIVSNGGPDTFDPTALFNNDTTFLRAEGKSQASTCMHSGISFHFNSKLRVGESDLHSTYGRRAFISACEKPPKKTQHRQALRTFRDVLYDWDHLELDPGLSRCNPFGLTSLSRAAALVARPSQLLAQLAAALASKLTGQSTRPPSPASEANNATSPPRARVPQQRIFSCDSAYAVPSAVTVFESR
ncbi:alpha-L-arabinofuranosidase B, catalytic-domain-containing protein [Mycena galopus ATCC 62051]|nr:alpha-L-arabinofuranosidase B, catalytic-domain-containing protein [Mycena galopus ATCC 62051]